LFEDFVNFYNGHIESVDINPENCKIAKNLVGNKVSINCSDSVEFLRNKSWNDVDLFYLDSYDVKWHRPEPSAEHHLKEFQAIEKYLKSGSIVAIDDNTFYGEEKSRTGKGKLIYQYLKSKNIYPIYDGYILIYIF
jgi:predicted O-methyltransferase YrrM